MNRILFKIGFLLMLIGLVVASFPAPVLSQVKTIQIKIRVDGLSCPFCAYGLEKKLKRLNGKPRVFINMERGIVEITIEGEKGLGRVSSMNRSILPLGRRDFST